jgi:hypothetical protein
MMSFIFVALLLVGGRSQPTADKTAASVVRAGEAQLSFPNEQNGRSDNSVVRGASQTDAVANVEGSACGEHGCGRQPVVRGVLGEDIFTVMREELRRASHVNETAGAPMVREESAQSTRVNRDVPVAEADDSFSNAAQRLAAVASDESERVNREVPATAIVREKSVQSIRVNREVPATEADNSFSNIARRLAAVAGDESTRVSREVSTAGIVREENVQLARVNREVPASEAEDSSASNIARRLSAVAGDESTRVNREVPAAGIVREESVQPTRVNREVLTAAVDDSFASSVARRLAAVSSDDSSRVNREVPSTAIVRERNVQPPRVNREVPATNVEDSFATNVARRLTAVVGDESLRVNREVPAARG